MAIPAQPLRQSRKGASRAIAKGAQGHLQSRQQDVNPLIGFALAHPEQASLDHLETVGLDYVEFALHLGYADIGRLRGTHLISVG
jgi:hypothetical protein